MVGTQQLARSRGPGFNFFIALIAIAVRRGCTASRRGGVVVASGAHGVANCVFEFTRLAFRADGAAIRMHLIECVPDITLATGPGCIGD